MVITSGCSASVCSTASWPLVAVPTTSIRGSASSISLTRRRKNPASSTTSTLTVICPPLPSPRVALEQAGNIQNQRDAPVTSDGRSRHAGRAMEHTPQRLDDHFFLPHQLVDHKTDPLGTNRH